MSFGERGLLVIADRTDDGSAEMLCPLREDQADAAGCGMEQDRVAGFDTIGLPDQILRRQALEHHGSRGLVIDAVRQLEQAVGGDQPLLRIGTDRRGPIGNPIAWFQVGDPAADLLDHARSLASKPVRQGQRIKARAIVDVEKVEPHGGMADARLPSAGLADLDFLPDKNLGPAGFVDADGVRHGTTP